jgi:hypothetical protein
MKIVSVREGVGGGMVTTLNTLSSPSSLRSEVEENPIDLFAGLPPFARVLGAGCARFFNSMNEEPVAEEKVNGGKRT